MTQAFVWLLLHLPVQFRVRNADRAEACCPYCGAWQEVAWDDTLPPGGYWWAAATDAGCPACGKLVLVESEAELRFVGFRVFGVPVLQRLVVAR